MITAVPAAADPAGTIYLVTGNATSLPAGDAQIRGLLAATGRTVVNLDDDGLSAAAVADGDLVVLSSSVATAKVNATLADIAVPLVTWEAFLHKANKLATANGESTAATKRIRIANAAHPIAAGRTGIVAVTTTTNKLSWGTIAPGGTAIAVVPGQPARATVFAYETGDLRTDATPAPSCRVGLFPDYNGASRLNANGIAIATAAINWALGCSAPPEAKCETADGTAIPTSIPETECVALIALYNSTNGPNWWIRTKWLTATDPCTWFRVVCSTAPAHVQSLRLDDNGLTGTLPSELGDLSELVTLDLASNEVSGPIPAELGELTRLQTLSMTSNQLTGSIPAELGDLGDLVTLQLGGNLLSGPPPTALGNLSQLQLMSLASNRLTGPIPTEFGGLSDLRRLLLHNNQFSGSIPGAVGDLANLEWLSLSQNQLTGSIPTELGDLTSLTQLLLASNGLTGSIPADLGDLTQLQFLDLGTNQLTGSIPARLGDLAQLGSLDLSENQLTGNLPSELGNLDSLVTLIVSTNGLSGDLAGPLASLMDTVFYIDVVSPLAGEQNCFSIADSAVETWLSPRDPDWVGCSIG